MYIENNSLVLFATDRTIPFLFIVKDKTSICVASRYSLVPSKKENVQLSHLDNIHKYIHYFKNIYLVNPRNFDIIKVFQFIKKSNWGGNFYLLFNV